MSSDVAPSPKAPTRVPRIAAALLVLWAGAVAYLTLAPGGPTPPLTMRSFLCIACGELDGSDLLRNWILFIPGGLFAAFTPRPRRWMALPVLVTCLVEFVQVGVPGRDPALQDLLTNTLGAASGYLLGTRGLSATGQRLVVAAALFAWLSPPALLVPLTTRFDLYGQWTPSFATLTHYEGRILESHVGNVALESRRTREKQALDAAILDRQPIRLRMLVGQHPRSWAPIFQVVDSGRRGIVELGALDADLILRGRTPARAARLDQPDVRWHDAMAGLARGDTVTLVVERGRDSICMSLDGRERCRLAPSLADGWAFGLNLEGPPRWLRELMSVLWATGLAALVGLTSPSLRRGVTLAVAVATLGYVAATFSPDVRPDLLHAVAFVGGGVLGSFFRGPARSLWSGLHSAQTHQM